MTASTPADHALVLIAEDDPEDLFLMQRALQRLRPGLATVAARDGIELFEYLQGCTPATLPKLLIIDLNMPRMDGREVLRGLHGDARYGALPVVVMTTSVEQEDFNFAQAHNTAQVLSKPEAFSEMMQRLGALLDTHFGVVEEGVR